MTLKTLRKADPLLALAGQMKEEIAKEGFAFYPGTDVEQSKPPVYWNREKGGDWKAFLQCAKALNANPIYMVWMSFLEFDVARLLPEDRKRYAQHVDQICMIEMRFSANGMMHAYHEVADWYVDFENVVGDDLDDDEDFEDEDLFSDKFSGKPF